MDQKKIKAHWGVQTQTGWGAPATESKNTESRPQGAGYNLCNFQPCERRPGGNQQLRGATMGAVKGEQLKEHLEKPVLGSIQENKPSR